MIFQNPLIQRYRFSLLRPKQVGIYGFLYAAIVALIILLNYTVFTTFKPLIPALEKMPFNVYQVVYYQFLGLQVVILWFWASYNSGSAVTVEILRKSYIFFKLLPISALQKAFGVLLGSNLLAYALGILNFIPLLVLAVLGQMNAVLVGYSWITVLAVACFLNTLTLLLSINPDAKKHRRLGTLILVVLAVWGLMFAMGMLFSTNRSVQEIQLLRVKFFQWELPGFPVFSALLLYFTAWMLWGIVRKFRDDRAPLFSTIGSLGFVVGWEIITTGLFWSFLHLQSSFYGHRVLCFWGLIFVNVSTLRDAGMYFETAHKLQSRSSALGMNLFRLLRQSTLVWGICLFLVWIGFFFGLSGKPALSFPDNLYALLNLFGFYLLFMMLLELFVLYRHLHLNLKVFLIGLAIVSLFLPLSLSKLLSDKLVYLHSAFGYMGNLITPFLLKGGNAAIQWRIFFVNLLLCVLPAVLILRNYVRFLTYRRQ